MWLFGLFCLFICLLICLSVYLFVHLFVYLFIDLFIFCLALFSLLACLFFLFVFRFFDFPFFSFLLLALFNQLIFVLHRVSVPFFAVLRWLQLVIATAPGVKNQHRNLGTPFALVGLGLTSAGSITFPSILAYLSNQVKDCRGGKSIKLILAKREKSAQFE